MNTREEYEQLKRNNRRRLIGAVVVVAIAAVILLKVLSHRGETAQVAEVDIGQTASQAQGQVMELPNSLGASEVAGASETAPIVDTPVGASETAGLIDAPVVNVPPEGAASETVQTPPQEAVPPVEKPVTVKPAPKKTEKPVVKPAPKLTPQEILDGKAGKTAAAPSTKSGALIQAGAFVNAQQAETQRNNLAKIGINAKVYRATTAKGEVYRVRIGPFASNEEARRTLDKVKANGFDGILVGQ